MDKPKLTQIYPTEKFKDSRATLLYKKNSKYYYDKEKTIEVPKTEMFNLFVNDKIMIVDSNGKYTEVISCTPDGTIKEAGTGGGEDGKSAYDIAVENGFVGTEAEWLDSLKAKKEKKCIISIIDDDGTNRTDDRHTGICSFLQEKNIPMAFAVPTDTPTKSSGAYTIEQLTQFVQDGNEVLMHGLSAADENAKTQTLEEFKASIDGSIDWARANGFTDNIYVYPRGMQPQDTLNFIEKIQYMISKGIIAGYNINTPIESSEVEGYEAWYSYVNGNTYNGVANHIPFVETPANFSKEMLLNRMECTRNTMTQNWWVNRLHRYIEEKTYIVLFFHSFTSEYSTEGSDGKTSADLFKELITSLVDTYGAQIEWLAPSDALEEIGKLPMTQADVRNMIISSKGNAETMTKEEMLNILNGGEN